MEERDDSQGTLPAVSDTVAREDAVLAPGPRSPSIAAGAVGLRLGPGITLGRFLVIEHLGEGGMGTVVAAYDPDLDRKVAIKILRASAWAGRGSSSEGRERLLREARAMAKLTHPNVLTVYDVGEVADQVFIAMEFAAGGTLREWMQRRQRTWREVVDVFVKAGRGLAAAHRSGLIHRDFKPDNVLFMGDGAVRVADFGLVAAEADDQPDAAPASTPGASAGRAPPSGGLTRTGAVVGTPAYMAPEQHAGQKLDARADQFAFCVALWQALYGARPFAGTTHAELAAAVREGKLRTLPDDAEVPPRVHDIVVRGLAADPAARHESMDALLAALATDPEATRRRRRRRAATAAAFIAVATLAVIALLRGRSDPRAMCAHAREHLAGVWDDGQKAAVRSAFLASKRPGAAQVYERVARQLDAYTDAWVRARTSVCEATHVRGEQSTQVLDLRMRCLDRRLGEARALIELFAARPDVVSTAIAATAKLGGLDICDDVDALRAIVPPPADPQVRARIQALDGRLASLEALLKSAKFTEALERARAVVTEARAVGYAPTLARSLFRLAAIEDDLGDAKKAAQTYTESARVAGQAKDDRLLAQAFASLVYVIGYREQKLDEARAIIPLAQAVLDRAGRPPFVAGLLLLNVGIVFHLQGDYDEAIRRYQQALAAWQKALGPEHLLVASPYNNLGAAYRAKGDYDQALRFMKRALAIREKTLDPLHADVAMALSNLGAIHFSRGEYDEALRFHRDALARREKALGPEHPDVALSLYNIGGVLLAAGKNEDARENEARALAIREKVLGPEHPDVAWSLTFLGVALMRLDRRPEARRCLERAQAIWEKALGPEHVNVAAALVPLGELSIMEGRYEEARRPLQRALAIREKALGPDHPDVAEPVEFLGLAAIRQGRTQEGQRLIERALAIREKALRPEHPDVAGTLADLGWALEVQGKDAEALPDLERAEHQLEQVLGPEHRALAFSLTALADVYRRRGDARKAVVVAARAVKIREAVQGERGPLAESRFALAQALWAAGTERERALRLGEQARATFAGDPGYVPELAKVKAWLRRASRK